MQAGLLNLHTCRPGCSTCTHAGRAQKSPWLVLTDQLRGEQDLGTGLWGQASGLQGGGQGRRAGRTPLPSQLSASVSCHLRMALICDLRFPLVCGPQHSAISPYAELIRWPQHAQHPGHGRSFSPMCNCTVKESARSSLVGATFGPNRRSWRKRFRAF